MTAPVARYGVARQVAAASDTEFAVEELRTNGFTVLERIAHDTVPQLSAAFDGAMARTQAAAGGAAQLAAIDEHNTLRAALAHDREFLALAATPSMLEVVRALMGDYVVLSQQNGIRNPPHGAPYNQAAWHRDLPYQHFTASRPLAINALFCLDDFTLENGPTYVLPGTHRQEEFPSDRFVARHARPVTAAAGSFILLDAMLYHTGSRNGSAAARRAVNHVYTIPLLRQQIDLPAFLGPDYTADPALRRLLGYGLETPRSDLDYLAGRAAR